MKSFEKYLKSESYFNDYEALASKYTKLFKKYNFKKVRSFKVPNAGISTEYELKFVCDKTPYKFIIRRERAFDDSYRYVYSLYSLKNEITNEELITKKSFIPETVNNYINFESFLKTVSSANSCDSLKKIVKYFSLHHSL